jgi:hypothetical protein
MIGHRVRLSAVTYLLEYGKVIVDFAIRDVQVNLLMLYYKFWLQVVKLNL